MIDMFEYKILTEGCYSVDIINSLGREGWELCGVVVTKVGTVLYFKRRLDEQETIKKE